MPDTCGWMVKVEEHRQPGCGRANAHAVAGHDLTVDVRTAHYQDRLAGSHFHPTGETCRQAVNSRPKCTTGIHPYCATLRE